jgi:hypothetical protein
VFFGAMHDVECVINAHSVTIHCDCHRDIGLVVNLPSSSSFTGKLQEPNISFPVQPTGSSSGRSSSSSTTLQSLTVFFYIYDCVSFLQICPLSPGGREAVFDVWRSIDLHAINHGTVSVYHILFGGDVVLIFIALFLINVNLIAKFCK